jgi:drug/metabolite transporter superfamily protein YnfA
MGPACASGPQGEDSMDKYDVIGLVIAIIAVSVVVMHSF